MSNKQAQPWYNIPKLPSSNKSAIVIGGGLAGSSAAYSLASRGYKVKLVERNDKLAAEASGNPAGVISPLLSHKNDIIGRFYLAAFRHCLQHMQQLQIPFSRCGVLDISHSKIDKQLASLAVPDSEVVRITAQEASKLCGSAIKSPALYIKNAGYVRPADLCEANVAAHPDKIELVYNRSAIKLDRVGDDWHVISDSGQLLGQAPVVVVANANDAKQFEQTNWLPLTAVRGQITYLPQGLVNVNMVISYDGGYITPEISGYNYVGATFSRNDSNLNVKHKDNKENLCNLRDNLDIGVEGKLDGRVSLRATSPDRRPIIGTVPDKGAFLQDYADLSDGKVKKYPLGKYLPGLYVSTGHGSRGLTSCPLAGEIIAQMACGEKLDEDITNSLNPARFIIRELKRVLEGD